MSMWRKTFRGSLHGGIKRGRVGGFVALVYGFMGRILVKNL